MTALMPSSGLVARRTLLPVHDFEGLLAVVTGAARLAGSHVIHGEFDATLLHLEQARMAVGALGSAGEVGRVRKGDGTRRPHGREGNRGRAGGGSLGDEAVTLGAGLAWIVLGPVVVARETGLSRRRRPGVRGVAGRAARPGMGRRLVQAGALRMAGRAVCQRLDLLVLLVALVARQARHGRARRSDLVTAA